MINIERSFPTILRTAEGILENIRKQYSFSHTRDVIRLCKKVKEDMEMIICTLERKSAVAKKNESEEGNKTEEDGCQ